MALSKDDYVGKRFGKLTVADLVQSKTEKRKNAVCVCDCGNEKEVRISALRSGATTSCGCVQADAIKQASITHGMTGTRLHNAWRSMKARCNIKSCSNYSEYGGRGISVCDEWNSNFEAFRDWALSNGYSDELSIDRVDFNGNYEPSNCRWSDKPMQARNRRTRITSNTGTAGVAKRKDNGKYRASICVEGKRINLGTHEKIEDAIKARRDAELEYWGFALIDD